MPRVVWGGLSVVLGVNLWALLSLVPLQVELQADDTRHLTVLVWLLPLVLLALGAATRLAPIVLFLFPVSLLPIFVMVPQADRVVHQTQGGFVSLAVSLVLYVVVSAGWIALSPGPRRLLGWLSRKQKVNEPRPRDATGLEPVSAQVQPLRFDLWWPYQLHFPPRWVLLLLLFLVPMYGLNFHEGALEAYSVGFGDLAPQARVMANLIFLFVWIVVAYLFFFSPGLNLELEQRAGDVALHRLEARLLRRPRLWAMLGLTAAASLALVIVVLWRY